MLSDRDVHWLEKLFDQQMWALGRDVVSPMGNLLARRGLVRLPAPPGASVSSTWVDREAGLSLNSAGVRLARNTEDIFFDRGPLKPQLARAGPKALGTIARWFAEYEDWVAKTAGLTWRAHSLAQRSRPPRFTAEAMPLEWARFAALLEAVDDVQAAPWPRKV